MVMFATLQIFIFSLCQGRASRWVTSTKAESYSVHAVDTGTCDLWVKRVQRCQKYKFGLAGQDCTNSQACSSVWLV